MTRILQAVDIHLHPMCKHPRARDWDPQENRILRWHHFQVYATGASSAQSMTTHPWEFDVSGYVYDFGDHQFDANSVHCWDRK